MRFYGIVLNLFVFVFVLIPHIDFFLASIIFLLAFFFMFYCGTDERLLDLIYFGDYTSVYLALALGQDPTPVTRIEELKRQLAAE